MNIQDLTNIWDEEAVNEVLDNPLADYIEYDADLNNISWFNTKTQKTVDIKDTQWADDFGIVLKDKGVISGWFLKKDLLSVCEEYKVSPFQALLAYIEGFYMQVWQRDNQCNAIYGECQSIYIHNLNWSTVH